MSGLTRDRNFNWVTAELAASGGEIRHHCTVADDLEGLLTSFTAAGRCVSIFQREGLPEIVIDEVCGFLVCMLFVPLNPINLALSFFLFRFFDIAKPFPIRRVEGLPGRYFIVMDNVLAWVYANFCLQMLVRFYWMMSAVFFAEPDFMRKAETDSAQSPYRTCGRAESLPRTVPLCRELRRKPRYAHQTMTGRMPPPRAGPFAVRIHRGK